MLNVFTSVFNVKRGISQVSQNERIKGLEREIDNLKNSRIKLWIAGTDKPLLIYDATLEQTILITKYAGSFKEDYASFPVIEVTSEWTIGVDQNDMED